MLARSVFILLASTALAACGDPTAPAMRRLAGTYEASRSTATTSAFGTLTFTTTQDGVTTDWLAEGAFIRLTLRANGTTTGRVFIPNVNEHGEREQGVSFDEELTGTWSVSDDIVHLDHAADTFLRDMVFHVRGDQLEGEEFFANVTVRVVLDRTS